MPIRVRVGLALTLILALGAVPASTASAATPEENLVASAKNGPLQKLGPWLGNLYDEYQKSTNKKGFTTRNPVLKVSGGKVGVQLVASDAARLQGSLTRLGATNVKAIGPIVSAQVPVSALGDLAALSSLEFGDAAMARVRTASQGQVVSQGDLSLRAPTARAGGFDGTGVTVGVMSDSYHCNPPAFVPGAPTSTSADDVATADVPAGVDVLDNGDCPGTDEGRAMAQLVHDVAPGAAQKFHTAFNSLPDFAGGMLEL